MRFVLKYDPLNASVLLISFAHFSGSFRYNGTTAFSSFVYRLRASSASSAPSSIAHPVAPSMQPSIHHPSRIDRLGTPFRAAFIPLVPDASYGRRGVFTHTSTPAVRAAPRSH